MTTRELALRLARHIGVTSFDPLHRSNATPLHGPGLRRGDRLEIAACLNGALYELWDQREERVERSEFQLMEPAEVVLELKVGGREVLECHGYEGWMKGCRVVIGGRHNRLRHALELEEAYLGNGEPEGDEVSRVATVFHDRVELGEEVAGIMGGSIRGGGTPGAPLKAVGERAAFDGIVKKGVENGDVSGLPEYYFFREDERSPAMAFYPAPDEALVFEYDKIIRMVEVREGDIGLTEDDGRGVKALEQIGAPQGWALEVVFPLALERLMLHPDFMDRAAHGEVKAQAARARRLVKGYEARCLKGGSVLPVFR